MDPSFTANPSEGSVEGLSRLGGPVETLSDRRHLGVGQNVETMVSSPWLPKPRHKHRRPQHTMEKAEEDPWSDPAGVREVLHRTPGAGQEAVRYMEYVPLQEFEEIKAAVKQEVLPMRRYLMSDYKMEGASTTVEEARGEKEMPNQLQEAAVPVPDVPSGPSASKRGQNAGRSASPKPDAVQVWLAAKERALQSPRKPLVLSPRGARAMRAAGRIITEDRPCEAEVHYETSQKLQVSHVNPMSLTMRRREPPGRGPFIKDKERAQYPSSGRAMRPVRETNEESLKKLIENFGGTARVDAKESHPSRSVFNTIPKTNLRVL
eukprot:s501_g18.t1